MKIEYIQWTILGIQFIGMLFTLRICIKSIRLHNKITKRYNKITKRYKEMDIHEFVNSEN